MLGRQSLDGGFSPTCARPVNHGSGKVRRPKTDVLTSEPRHFDRKKRRAYHCTVNVIVRRKVFSLTHRVEWLCSIKHSSGCHIVTEKGDDQRSWERLAERSGEEMWTAGYTSTTGGRWRRQHRTELNGEVKNDNDDEKSGMWPMFHPLGATRLQVK